MEKQKSLPFKFRVPRLQHSRDKSQARISWRSQGKTIADHKEHMVKKVREGDNFTWLYSSWVASTHAQRQLETLLADLGKGTSWLNMYKMTVKACVGRKKSLPFNFCAPRLEVRQDKSQARMVWQSEGKIIVDHKEHMVKRIAKSSKREKRTSLYSSYMAPTDAQRQLETLLADLSKGTSWLDMYKMTAKACIGRSHNAAQRRYYKKSKRKLEDAPGNTSGAQLVVAPAPIRALMLPATRRWTMAAVLPAAARQHGCSSMSFLFATISGS